MAPTPSPPLWQFKPFSHHIDGGFGAIGDAFMEAASRLEMSESSKPFFQSSLPIAYLHRHACELFLKSCVIVVHRGLGVPFGDRGPAGQPAIKIAEDWVSIERVHNVGDIYRRLTFLLIQHASTLLERTGTDWSSIPEELGSWISLIEEFDRRSTFFRYPSSGDEIKADFRETSITEIGVSIALGEEYVKFFAETDENDRVTAYYCLDPSRLQPLLDALRSASDAISTLHFALRSTLAGGN